VPWDWRASHGDGSATSSEPLGITSHKLVAQSGGLSCEPRRYCSQISSCEDAQWYLHNCTWGVSWIATATAWRARRCADGFVSFLGSYSTFGTQTGNAFIPPALPADSGRTRRIEQEHRSTLLQQTLGLSSRPGGVPKPDHSVRIPDRKRVTLGYDAHDLKLSVRCLEGCGLSAEPSIFLASFLRSGVTPVRGDNRKRAS
jgi:hypothetical protein